MDTGNLFPQYARAICSLNLDALTDASSIPKEFLLGQHGKLGAYYIPFDRVNAEARVVLVGITPGFTQWRNAIAEAQRQLLAGASLDAAHQAAKKTGGFSGTMRPNLVRLLDRIGMHQWLKIDSCANLFDRHYSLVQTTSILRHPIFIDGMNYSGTPSMVKTPFLRRQISDYFALEAVQINNPLYIQLGPKVSEGLAWLAAEGLIKADRILDGLPHPSGANAERIAYFLGEKTKATLSAKTNGDKLDQVRAALTSRIAALG